MEVEVAGPETIGAVPRSPGEDRASRARLEPTVPVWLFGDSRLRGSCAHESLAPSRGQQQNSLARFSTPSRFELL